MRSYLVQLSLAASLLATACNENKPAVTDEDGVAVMRADSLAKHIAVLASDEFMAASPLLKEKPKPLII